MASPAATAELRSFNLQYLDPGIPEAPVGAGVPIICNDHPRPESDNIISLVPLLTGGLVFITTGRENPEAINIKGSSNGTKETLLFRYLNQSLARSRSETVSLHTADNLREDRTSILIEHGKDRI
jgi:hypothetical protein